MGGFATADGPGGANRAARRGAARGMPEEFADIFRALPDYRPAIIFDVGANVGQSCTAYAAALPDARIHAFEPVPATFDKLAAAVADHPHITAHRLALGRDAGTARMAMAAGGSTTARIVQGEGPAQGMVDVRMAPGYVVAAELGVEAISYLKIDTEGFDLDVVLGFAPMLGRVDFVQVEAGMNPYNRTHVPFRALEDALRECGFLLFGFYEQQLEWKRGGRPVLRRTNPLFINGRLVDVKGIR